jgi:hypothetical protein
VVFLFTYSRGEYATLSGSIVVDLTFLHENNIVGVMDAMQFLVSSIYVLILLYKRSNFLLRKKEGKLLFNFMDSFETNLHCERSFY